MTFATIRTAMKELLEDVVGIGEIHDYVRHTRFWDEFFNRTIKDGRVNQWEITRSAAAQTISAADDASGVEPLFHDTHNMVIFGRMSLDDSAESEKDFQALIDNIVEAVRKDTRLGGLLILPREMQVPLIEHREYGGVLTHFARLEFEAIERVGGN